jgi:hypothetical protein
MSYILSVRFIRRGNVEELLTPKEVPSLPKISLRDIYINQNRLGEFCLAGIRMLRF